MALSLTESTVPLRVRDGINLQHAFAPRRTGLRQSTVHGACLGRVFTNDLSRLLQVFRLAGASFESVDDEQLNNWHERLNVLWRNIAAPGIGLWTHTIRRRETLSASPEEVSGFAGELQRKYERC